MIALLILAGLADIATTLYGLRLPGVREANPIYGRRPSAAVLLAVRVAVIGWLLYAGAGDDVLLVVALAWFAAAAWNLRQIMRAKR